MIVHHVAREQVSVNTVITLTASKVNTARGDGYRRTVYADIDVQDYNIYVTFDGSTTPSASAGEIWYTGQKYRVWGIQNLLNLKFIKVSSTAILEVNYWGDN